MADISITAANVIAATTAKIEHGSLAATTITAGKALYKNSDGKWDLADCDSATVAARTCGGIALNGASAGQPVSVLLPGSDITIGATLTPGSAYYLSPVAGGIGLIAEVLSGDYVSLIGLALSASVLSFAPKYTGVAL